MRRHDRTSWEMKNLAIRGMDKSVCHLIRYLLRSMLRCLVNIGININDIRCYSIFIIVKRSKILSKGWKYISNFLQPRNVIHCASSRNKKLGSRRMIYYLRTINAEGLIYDEAVIKIYYLVTFKWDLWKCDCQISIWRYSSFFRMIIINLCNMYKILNSCSFLSNLIEKDIKVVKLFFERVLVPLS